jgi:tetrahydromethanopterin S-methyltransferase subunit F
LNNLLVISRNDAGAEAIIAYDNDLKHLSEFIQRNERICILGTLIVFIG